MPVPNTTWQRVFRRAGITPVLLVQIDLDGSTSRKFVSGDEPLFGYQPLVANCQAMAARVDPISRKVQAGDVTITFKDSKVLQKLVKDEPLKGHRVKVFLGCEELTNESDWYQVFAGAVDDVLPGPHRTSIAVHVLDAFGLITDLNISFIVDAIHPLEAIEQLLTQMGVAAELIDTDSLNPDHPNYADNVGHWLVTRQDNAAHGDLRAQLTPFPGLKAIEEAAVLMNGGLVPTNDGKIRFARYNHSAAAVATWDKSVIRGMRQKESTRTLINHANLLFGWTGGGDPTTVESGTPWAPHQSNGTGEFRYAVSLKDNDSIARYVFGASSSQQFYRGLQTKWTGHRTFLSGTISAAATTIIAHSSQLAAFCGARQTGANAAPSAARPVYLRIDDEIIKCDAVTWDTTSETIPPDLDEDGNPTGDSPDGAMASSIGAYNPGAMSSSLGGNQVGGGALVTIGTFTVASGGRGVNGTTAAAHGSDAEIIDVTIAVQLLNEIVGRCSDGLKIIEVDVPIWEITPDYADNVSITHDAFLAYQLDGLAGTEKWEVIGKTLHVIDREPHITYVLASARTPPVVSNTWGLPDYRFDGPIGRGDGHIWEDLSLRFNEDVVSNHVSSGFAVSSPSGRNIVISSGTIHHRGRRQKQAGRAANYLLPASRDCYLWWDVDRKVFVVKDVANGAAAPATAPPWVLIAKIVVGATAVTTITQSFRKRAIRPSRLYDYAIRARNVDRDTVWARNHLLRNADFGCPPEDDDYDVNPFNAGPPDGWSMNVGAWGTDAAVHLGAKSGPSALRLLDTAVATELWSPAFPVEDSRLYRFGADWKASGTTVTFTCEVFWYTERNLATAASTPSNTAVTKVAGAADTYELGFGIFKAPSDARYARLKIRKSTTTQTVTIDRVIAEEHPVRFHVHKAGTDQSGVGTGETLITWSTAEYSYGSHFDLATELFTVPRTGLYAFGWSVGFNSCPDGTQVVSYLKKDPVGAVGSAIVKSGSWPNSSFASSFLVSNGSCEIELNAGDTIGVYAQTTGASRTVTGAAHYTYFWGREITP